LINVGNLHERKTQKLFQQKVDGKTIIVTGASSGIGLTVSKYLAQAGAHVLLLARTKEKLDEVKAEIEAEGGKASVFPCDLNDMESIDAVSKEILAAVDHIDILSIMQVVQFAVLYMNLLIVSMILNVPCN
jgi:NAD(P)-dependent dehydrogenase (short-subunit alcohol dehydrogenase family)